MRAARKGSSEVPGLRDDAVHVLAAQDVQEGVGGAAHGSPSVGAGTRSR